jgi:hypothetical protein
MARTNKGNLTGRAAAENRRDEKEHALTIGSRVDLDGIRARLKQHEKEAVQRCIAMEGEKAFYAWYTGKDGAVSERIEMIENRIQELEADQRYAIVDGLLGTEGAHPFKIMDAAEAMDGN